MRYLHQRVKGHGVQRHLYLSATGRAVSAPLFCRPPSLLPTRPKPPAAADLPRQMRSCGSRLQVAVAEDGLIVAEHLVRKLRPKKGRSEHVLGAAHKAEAQHVVRADLKGFHWKHRAV